MTGSGARPTLGTHGKHSRPHLAIHSLLLLDRVECCGLEARLERVQKMRHMVHFGLPVCESAARYPLLCLRINECCCVSVGPVLIDKLMKSEALEVQTRRAFEAHRNEECSPDFIDVDTALKNVGNPLAAAT